MRTQASFPILPARGRPAELILKVAQRTLASGIEIEEDASGRKSSIQRYADTSVSLANASLAWLTRQRPDGLSLVLTCLCRIAISSIANVTAATCRGIGRGDALFRTDVFAGLGRTSAQHLQGVIKALLESMRLSLEASAWSLAHCIASTPDPLLMQVCPPRTRCFAPVRLQMIGKLGMRVLLPPVRSTLNDDDVTCKVWAAWTFVLLGDHSTGLESSASACGRIGPLRVKSMRAVFGAMQIGSAHLLLRATAKDPVDARRLIRGAGFAGDPTYVPWLIKQMETIRIWWGANATRFSGGTRYFMGQP